jgi:lysophospholipase L1-like esterase
VTARPTRRRQRVWLALFGVVLAFTLFGAAELALRALGIGERRELLEFPDPSSGATVLTREPSWPQVRADHGAALDRIAVARAKPPGTWRVVIVGESTVAGFPFHPELSFGRLLEASLRDSFPELAIEVVNFGRIADPSDAVAQAAIEALDVAPDLLVVCSGHNDFQASYVEDLRDGIWPRVRARLRRLRLVKVGFERVLSRTAAPLPSLAEGRRVGDAPWLSESEFERGAERFRANLESIVDAARARAVDVALVTPVSNLRDFAPCYSHFTRKLGDAEKREYERLLGELESQVAATLLPFESARTVERLRSLDPGVALAAYLAAKRSERIGLPGDASLLYALALERDGYPNRARAAFSAAVRAVAAEKGARLVDAEADFARAARGPAPGSDLFLDYCHPTLEGMAKLADSVRPAVLEMLVRAGAPLPTKYVDRPMLERRPLDDWLARLGLSRARAVDGLVRAAQGTLLLHLGLPANREALRLARNGFDQALRVVPAHVEARQGRLAIDLLDGERDAALARAGELARDAPDALRKLEEVAREMEPLRAALARLGLEFRDGVLVQASAGG